MNATNRDEDHLRLLSIFHYVLAGMVALFALFPIIHLIIGVVMVVTGSRGSQGGPPIALGFMFILVALAIIILGFIFAGLIVVAGRFLAQRKHYIYCMVIAALECTMFPFGVVLGVFTIIVLSRESVKSLFYKVPPAFGPGVAR